MKKQMQRRFPNIGTMAGGTVLLQLTKTFEGSSRAYGKRAVR